MSGGQSENRSPDDPGSDPAEIRDRAGRLCPASRFAHAAYILLRPYTVGDEEVAIALWLRAWQAAYPGIDFAERLDWWRARWRHELVKSAEIVIAESGGAIVGLVTVDPRTCYLDQIVVAPERWRTGVGAALIEKAKCLSPNGLDLEVNTDNERAIRFYQRLGFFVSGAGVNAISARRVHRMSWRP